MGAELRAAGGHWRFGGEVFPICWRQGGLGGEVLGDFGNFSTIITHFYAHFGQNSYMFFL